MSKLYVIEIDRRAGDKVVKNDRRDTNNRFIEDSKLDDVLEIHKWKHESLLSLIDNKEKKKLMVTYFSFVMLTLISGAMASVISLIIKGGMEDVIKYSLYIFMALMVFSVILINLSVIKYIAAFKRDILQAFRQLNRTRQSIAAVVFSKLERKLPNKNFILDKGEQESKGNKNLYWPIYGQHIMYPINNEPLRSIYFKKDKSGKSTSSYSYSALYKSVDLFTMSAIVLITLGLSLTPLSSMYYVNIKNSTTFNDVAMLSYFSAGAVILFMWGVISIFKEFLTTSAKPLEMELLHANLC